MEERSCFDTDRLRQVFRQGRFADRDEARRALDHFTRPCRDCWEQLTALAAEGAEIDIGTLEHHAAENHQELPLALALGRLVLVARRPAAAAALPPTQRYLLHQTNGCESFGFWWLLIEETRLLALNSVDLGVERWQSFDDKVLGDETLGDETLGDETLGDHPELELLIRAYKADEIRVAGRPHAAKDFLSGVLPKADSCRPEIRATIYEIRADLDRIERNPSGALKNLAKAGKLLEDEKIPGRRAETQIRVALTRLSEGDIEPAEGLFQKALDLIPPGTDPRLRLEIFLHQASIQVRLDKLNLVRPVLEEAEPFFETHAHDLMRAQRAWLWGLVHLDEEEFSQAESLFFEALQGFEESGASQARVQVLAHLVLLFIRCRNDDGLRQTLPQLTAALGQSSDHDPLDLNQSVDWVLQSPTLRELQDLDELGRSKHSKATSRRPPHLSRQAITRDTVAEALRLLRADLELTQKEVVRRARVFSGKPFGRLLESQISDFERGRTLPSFGSLLNLLAAFSADGSEVDFTLLQEALVIAIAKEGGRNPTTDQDSNPKSARELALELADLFKTFAASTEQELQQIKDETALLRVRIAEIESDRAQRTSRKEAALLA